MVAKWIVIFDLGLTLYRPYNDGVHNSDTSGMKKCFEIIMVALLNILLF